MSDNDKQRRRLPPSVKELIEYHNSNGIPMKDIVEKINAVSNERTVNYGYVQKYLYRKKLEASAAKKARYYRKKYGYVYRRMRRKPVLSENHLKSRIDWCIQYQNDKFEQDIFMGSTSIKLVLTSLNQQQQLISENQSIDETFQDKVTTSLQLWGAISKKGASALQIFDGSLCTTLYLEFLMENEIPFIKANFRDSHRFHQDNNPKHSAKLTQEFLEATGINWVKCPPKSHDLNPIELVWNELVQVVAKRLPKTTDQVCQAIKDYWQTLTPQKCSQFIDKLTEIIHQVLEKNGEWIA